MGSVLRNFGHIEQDLDGEPEAPPVSKRTRTPSFGELDLESLGDAFEHPRRSADPRVDDDDDERLTRVVRSCSVLKVPFGTLEPVVDDIETEDQTAIVGPSANSSRLAVMTSRCVPRLLVGLNEMMALPMDPRAAFLVGHIDGVQSMEEILDVCAMPEAEAIELFERLRLMGVIALD